MAAHAFDPPILGCADKSKMLLLITLYIFVLDFILSNAKLMHADEIAGKQKGTKMSLFRDYFLLDSSKLRYFPVMLSGFAIIC